MHLAQKYVNRLLATIPVVLLFMQYQVTWLSEESPIRPAINIFLLSCAAAFIISTASRKFVNTMMLAALLSASVLLMDMSRTIASGLMFGYGVALVLDANKLFNQTLKAFFIINGAIIVFQVLGVDAIFYKFQFYSPNWESFISVLNDGEGLFLPHQHRPSGVFPSTIYLSLFQLLIFGQLVAPTIEKNSALTKFIVGFVFSFIGSTVSQLLFVFSFIYLLRRRRSFIFQIGFLSGLFLLLSLSPALVETNYTINEAFTRIDTRFISDAGNSLLTANWVLFLAAACTVVGFIFVVRVFAIRFGRLRTTSIVTFLILGITPLVVHPFLEDYRYWFVLGTACAQLLLSTLGTTFDRIAAGKAQSLRTAV